jgi:hypothetical protein
MHKQHARAENREESVSVRSRLLFFGTGCWAVGRWVEKAKQQKIENAHKNFTTRQVKIFVIYLNIKHTDQATR